MSEKDAELIAYLAAGKLIDDGHYKAVFILEIRQQNNDLSISRYIKKTIEVEELDIDQELKVLNNYQVEFEQSQKALKTLLAKYQ